MSSLHSFLHHPGRLVPPGEEEAEGEMQLTGKAADEHET